MAQLVIPTHCFLLSTEIVLHPPSGLLYLACSTPAKRQHWLPALVALQHDKAVLDDYIATYDSATGTVTQLAFSSDFPTSQGYGSHGMDVVPSATDPKELFVYAVNHRKPVHGRANQVGADSVIEIFKTTVGGKTLTHLRTIKSPIIDTPNDLVGSPDGKSFYFTNDHGVKLGFVRRTYLGWYVILVAYSLFLVQVSRVFGFCLDFRRVLSCRRGLQDCCGWLDWKQWHCAGTERHCLCCRRQTRPDPCPRGAKRSLSRIGRCYCDGWVVFAGILQGIFLNPFLGTADRFIDNLSMDTNDALWAAGVADGLAFISAFNDLKKVAPSSAIRVTKNVGNEAFFGEKLKVEKVRRGYPFLGAA